MKRWIALSSPLLLALAVVSTSGCNGAASPTEPAFVAEDSASLSSIAGESRATLATGASSSSDLVGARHGADDPPGDDRGGRNGGGNGGRNGGRNGGGNTRPRPAGTEFVGGVAGISGSTITLSTGKKVTVSATTVWNVRGDLTTLAQLQTAFNRGRAPRVEGRGARQADGSIAAASIKAEIDN